MKFEFKHKKSLGQNFLINKKNFKKNYLFERF